MASSQLQITQYDVKKSYGIDKDFVMPAKAALLSVQAVPGGGQRVQPSREQLIDSQAHGGHDNRGG
jgi:hypothetical protein